MKDKLTNALGAFGAVLFYLISVAVFGIPLWYLSLPIWATVLLYLFITNIPIIGDIVGLGVYIWALVVALRSPIGVLEIVLFAFFVLYFIAYGWPLISALIARVKGNSNI